MNRLLTSLSTIAMLCAAASAQCFETNVGTLIGTGDDTLLPLQAMNISFPMGASGPYTHIAFNTNGACFLSTGAAPAGATATGYGSAATMLTNLRGAVGGAPRIAPYWRDMDMRPANNGGVYLNNTIPGKCVVTWQNAQAWNLLTSPIFTFQAQLYADGHVDFYYGGSAQNATVAPMCGISVGNNVVAPAMADLSVGATGGTSLIMYQSFATANTFDLGGKTVSFYPNGLGGYDRGVVACGASNVNYGAGCGQSYASFYQLFTTSASASAALSNTAIGMTNLGSTYLVLPSAAAYVTPSATATNLALGDDSQAPITLSAAMPFPGGSSASLMVCSNGFVSAATGNGTGFTPTGAAFVAMPQTVWGVWHDWNPAEVGSGAVKFEEVGGIAYVTWENVENYPGVPTVNPGTMQLQFEVATGNVNMVFGLLDAIGGSTFGDNYLVGYSPAGANLDPGSINLATAMPLTTSVTDVSPLALACSPNPVLGNTLVYTTNNIPASALLTFQLMSLGGLDPGFDLGGLGAPGCLQSVDLTVSATTLLIGAPSATFSLTLPTDVSFVGLPLHGQSASVVLSANPLGVITSNGVRSIIGSF